VHFFKIFGILFSALKSSKVRDLAGLISLVIAGGVLIMQQVEAKHQDSLLKISENRERVISLLVVQEKVLAKLDAIKESVDETKGQVDRTRDRVWQIGRDIYILRNKKEQRK